MIDVGVQITGADDLRSYLSGLAAQIPFATSVAINNTLNDIQVAERAHIHTAFIVRSSDFIDRSVYIGPTDRANKNRLEGTVRINPDRDVLAKFEDGGAKTPLRAASLAVPIFNIGGPAIIRRGDPLSIRNLFLALQKKGVAEGRLKRRKGSMDVQPRVYLVTNARGTYIVQGQGQSGKVLYAFEKSVPIKPELQFVQTALDIVDERWQQNASDALDYAIATAK